MDYFEYMAWLSRQEADRIKKLIQDDEEKRLHYIVDPDDDDPHARNPGIGA